MIVQSPEHPDSREFYSKLGFNFFGEQGNYVSDGKIIIRLNSNISKAGIMLFRPGLREMVEKLSSQIHVRPVQEGFEFTDPSSTVVTLVETKEVLTPPEVASESLTGNFSGISIGPDNPEHSIELWKLLGFKTVAGSSEDGWAVMADDNSSAISILKRQACPHKFFNPSLTYFNGKNNINIINGIKKAGLKIEEEITVFNDKGLVDNIIIRDPGGLGFFIFNDEPV